jgi:acetoin utilization deacetylase AcuC-like enzyme
MKVYYSDTYTVQLPPGHRFPMAKYRLVRLQLLAEGLLSPEELFEPALATPKVLALAHTPAYVEGICTGSVEPRIMRKIGFPWSPELVTRSLASVGGALAAAEEALSTGISGNLAGGTHHAQAAEGGGYCVFNDLAVVTLHLLSERRVRRVAIVDLDVHQGNGTAAILGSHPDVFTFSMHAEKNYPYQKVSSSLDIGLADGTGDREYHSHLVDALDQVFDFAPDIVLYQAGVDPLAEDTLGRLCLTRAGLAERDRIVLEACHARAIPVSLALGGGYADPIAATVAAHAGTYRAVREVLM